MAVTQFQRKVLKVLAQHRLEAGGRYVAGGVALNVLLAKARRSHDIDVFHDTETALATSWANDRRLLEAVACRVEVVREGRTFVEAMVSGDDGRTVMQWACDSAFRFFPLIEDELLGLTLHPFDLATNKVLAMAGRLEVRDWIDVLHCDADIQPLGFLAWAACGKDPGYNPVSLLASAARSHYSQAEIDTLDFEEKPPSAAVFGRQWHAALAEAGRIVEALPVEHVGTCVMTPAAELFRGSAVDAATALAEGDLRFHAGSIHGAWPSLVR